MNGLKVVATAKSKRGVSQEYFQKRNDLRRLHIFMKAPVQNIGGMPQMQGLNSQQQFGFFNMNNFGPMTQQLGPNIPNNFLPQFGMVQPQMAMNQNLGTNTSNKLMTLPKYKSQKRLKDFRIYFPPVIAKTHSLNNYKFLNNSACELRKLSELEILHIDYPIVDYTQTWKQEVKLLYSLMKFNKKVTNFSHSLSFMGMAGTQIKNSAIFPSLRKLSIEANVVFDLGEEIQNLKEVITSFSKLESLRLKLSGDVHDINYQFPFVLEIVQGCCTRLKNLELSTELKTSDLQHHHFRDQTTGYPILFENTISLNSVIQKLSMLKSFKTTYNYSPIRPVLSDEFVVLNFSALKDLEELNIEYKDFQQFAINWKLFSSVINEISSLKLLRVLSLNLNNSLMETSLILILSSLRGFTHLNKLVIQHNPSNVVAILPPDLQVKSFDLKDLPTNLTSLELGWTTHYHHLESIMQFIGLNKNLQSLELDLRNGQVVDKDVSSAILNLKELTKLKMLKIQAKSANFFSNQAFTAFAEIIKGFDLLEILDLTFLSPTQQLANSNDMLEKISTQQIQLTSDVKAFLNIIGEKQRLRHLYIGFRLHVENHNDLKFVMEILSGLRKLEELAIVLNIFFQNYKMDPKGKELFLKFTELISQCRNLKKLMLGGDINQIGDRNLFQTKILELSKKMHRSKSIHIYSTKNDLSSLSGSNII